MRRRILIADDVEMNRDMLSEILEEDYIIEIAENGKQVIALVEKYNEEIAAVLLDLWMPEMDGFAVLEDLKRREWLGWIPVLVISGERSLEIENKCFELGVSDFIHKPFEPSLVKNRVKNTVDLVSYKNHLEEKVEKQTETLKKQYRILQAQAATLRENNERIIEILGAIVESRNLESGEHIKRVKGFTQILAHHMMEQYPEYGLDERKIGIIVNASSLHDVGKIAIPDAILLKPGKLTAEEFDTMKSHTTKGCDILNHIGEIWEEEYRDYCYEICRHHHERHDGRGYPDGLKGDDIPVAAQIVSVADVYDALVCERCYKDAFPKDKAFNMIQNGECGTFSPKLMVCFEKAREEFEQLADEMRS